MIRKAQALHPPCTVGLIAPASAPRTEGSLRQGVANLATRGIKVVTKRPSFDATGYLAGTDEDRLGELNAFLQDDSVDALFCVRGGYGSLRILSQIDYEAARKHPKLLVGYSDTTALQLAMFRHAGWIGISGPMVSVEWSESSCPSCDHFLDLVSPSFETGPLDPNHPQMSAFVEGSASGRLLGGNLSLITRLIGTDFLPDLAGCVLFLEEIGETPYRIDGLLAQMQLAGILDSLAGVVLGGFTEGEVEAGKPSLTLEEVFDDYFGDLGIPVASGLRYGHYSDKISVPVGVQCQLDASNGIATLTLMEAPVLTS